MEYLFIYNNSPAKLLFSDTVGELSELRYLDKGIDTLLKIEQFSFNERYLKLTIIGERWVYYNDGTLIKSPEQFSVDATSQENIDYFANISTPKMSATVKRMQVNGVAIAMLGFQLFDLIGVFNPDVPEA